MNTQRNKTLTVTGISGGVFLIGETLAQKVDGETKRGEVVGIATERDFLAHHPEYSDYPFLLFENYYWIETENQPPAAASKV